MSDTVNTVFFIGNGGSRRGFLLSSLRSKGIMVGCNKAFLDYPDFDFMFSIDTKATKLISKEFKGMHIFNDNFKTPDIYAKTLSWKLCEMPKLRDKLDSGKVAVYLIGKYLKPDRLIMLGMDYGGEDLYTCNFSNRTNYLEDWQELLEPFKEVYRVGPPKEELDTLNFKQISYEELKDIL